MANDTDFAQEVSTILKDLGFEATVTPYTEAEGVSVDPIEEEDSEQIVTVLRQFYNVRLDREIDDCIDVQRRSN